tara:strand:- start:16127 stop:16600 length:474 start_codon:yes stop_codon:yes gene_type:complete
MTSLKQTALGQLLNRAKLILDMDLVWYQVFSDPTFKRWILDLVRQDQLFDKGVDEDDDIIGTYSEATEMMNPSKIAGTHYTLFDSGDFYKSFVIRVGKRIFEIDADTSEMDGENWWVQNNITKDAILGLTDENKTKLSVEVKRRFIIEARKILLRNT